MSRRQTGWISRRGQADAAAAVALVLERQPQETVQQLADAQIEDSPYQARRPIDEASVAELAQGMRTTGFQGVLFVRPHGELAKRRGGVFQLVYGHRRRTAWRIVCRERGISCELPVVVREVTDAELLLIGAQENLQRQDLDPVEEAQIVAWAERTFFDQNQAALGALLGKSSDWVSTRSRIHRLPEAIKALLRQRPRAIGQALELGILAQRDPDGAAALAERVASDNLTLEVVRGIVRAETSVSPAHVSAREGAHKRRDIATSVSDVTDTRDPRGGPTAPAPRVMEVAPPGEAAHLLRWCEEAAGLLERIAERADLLPDGPETARAVARITQALERIRARAR